MKKILLIVSGLFPNIKGGGDIYVNNLINFLSSIGCYIDVYIAENLSEQEKEICTQFYKNINLYFAKLATLNLPSKFIQKKLSWVHSVLILKKGLENFNLNKYDLILDHTILNFKQLRKNIKAFYIIHTSLDYLQTQWIPKKNKSLIKNIYNMLVYFVIISPLKLSMSFKYYENIIVPSLEVKTNIENSKKIAKKYKINIIANGVSNNNFRNEYNANSHVLSILRFENITKNLVFLNEVSKNLDYPINVYGFGKDIYLLKDVLINEWIQERKKVFDTLQNYSLFIMTSDVEGCPYSVVESLSVGVPIVIRNTFPGASKLVINNFNGLIFDKSVSPKDMAYEIRKLLSNKQKLKEMSKNCITHFNKYYSIHIFNENWRKIIDS